MIVLYPQATTSTFPYNPKACWDWYALFTWYCWFIAAHRHLPFSPGRWGYTNSAYATQQGQQLSAVKAMVNALTGKH
jgi:hypothetical protein